MLLAVACAPADDPLGSDGEDAVATSGVGAETGAGAGASGPGGSGVGGASTSVGAGGEVADTAMADVGTLVVLGDSIGDGGGQGPFYYQLLPDQLSAHYGKAVAYVNRAQSGSTTAALVGQVAGLDHALSGPVAVVITSGGNDMKDNLYQVLLGIDGPARAQMGANIEAALDALLEPGRFGAGVEVRAFYANIYDASDGQGNFADGGCVVSMNSPSGSDLFFANWNGEIALRVDGAGQDVVDMHGAFYGHGFNHPPSWYAGDCTHPSSVGHAELAALFHQRISGVPPGS